MALISIANLSFSYGERQVLDGVNLTLSQGEHVGLVGRNGCGKSTLLRLVAGLLEATAGRLSIEGSPLELSRFNVLYPYSRWSLCTRSIVRLRERFDPAGTCPNEDCPRNRSPTSGKEVPSTMTVAGIATSVCLKSAICDSQSSVSNSIKTVRNTAGS